MSKTTERIDSLTPLEMIDVVIEYFSSPGAVLSIEDNTFSQCKYRTEDGRKCAVGVFIDDSDYSPDFENKTLDVTEAGARLLHRQGEFVLTCDLGRAWVMECMQSLHDTSDSVEELCERLLDLRRYVEECGVPTLWDPDFDGPGSD